MFNYDNDKFMILQKGSDNTFTRSYVGDYSRINEIFKYVVDKYVEHEYYSMLDNYLFIKVLDYDIWDRLVNTSALSLNWLFDCVDEGLVEIVDEGSEYNLVVLD